MTEEEKYTNRIRIGSRISEIRKQQGLSVRQLADKCGVTYVNISKIENGRYNVGLDILQKIAEALGMDVDLVEKNKGA